MTTLEALIYATLHAHRVTLDEEIRPNEWRALCACRAVVTDHAEHLAHELHTVISPLIPVSEEQLTLGGIA